MPAPDQYEPNEDPTVAAAHYMGTWNNACSAGRRDDPINNLTIHQPSDQDWFRWDIETGAGSCAGIRITAWQIGPDGFANYPNSDSVYALHLLVHCYYGHVSVTNIDYGTIANRWADGDGEWVTMATHSSPWGFIRATFSCPEQAEIANMGVFEGVSGIQPSPRNSGTCGFGEYTLEAIFETR